MDRSQSATLAFMILDAAMSVRNPAQVTAGLARALEKQPVWDLQRTVQCWFFQERFLGRYTRSKNCGDEQRMFSGANSMDFGFSIHLTRRQFVTASATVMAAG